VIAPVGPRVAQAGLVTGFGRLANFLLVDSRLGLQLVFTEHQLAAEREGDRSDADHEQTPTPSWRQDLRSAFGVEWISPGQLSEDTSTGRPVVRRI
jgi:hypothetical protein